MRVPGLKTSKLAARWLRSRIVGGTLILGYHRVADTDDDPYDLCVSRRNFGEQVEAIRREANPLALQDFVAALRGGEVPRRAVVVTFDDGYADNLYNAKRELERYEVPATLFVATGYIGGEFWWDELAWLVPASPAALEPVVSKFEACLDDGKALSLDLGRSRRAVLNHLLRWLQSLTKERRTAVFECLEEWRGPKEVRTELPRALTEEELLCLSEGGLVDIGAHTVSHSLLAELPAEHQHAEISESKHVLEKLLQHPVRSFAYPNGSIGSATPDLVREAGFTCACSSFNDLAAVTTDPYSLPRFWVGNCGGDEFSRWLRRWVS